MKNRYLLSLAVISSMVLVNYSFAQDEAASDVEEVVTTGSRIARPETATSAPVTVVDAGDIKASGLTDLGEVLRRIAATQGSVPDLSTNNGGSGGVRYSLRGIGTSRTLILLNGRRVVPMGNGAADHLIFHTFQQQWSKELKFLKTEPQLFMVQMLWQVW